MPVEIRDLCLRAAPLDYRENTLAMLEEGLDLLRRAIALDGGFIQAKVLVCTAHTGAFGTRWWTHEKAAAAMPVAREIHDANPDDDVALAYAGHYIAYIGKEPREGLTAVTRASHLNPNSATVAMLLGWVHIYLGNVAEAIGQFQRFRRIGPLHPQIGIVSCGMGNALMQDGDLEGAVTWYEQALTEYPEFASIHLGLIGCYWKLGRLEDSARMAAWFRAKVPDMSVTTFLKTRPQTNRFYRETLVAALEANGFPP